MCMMINLYIYLSAVGPDHLLAERHFVILMSTLVFTLPLSLYRNVEKLGKVSVCIALPSKRGRKRMLLSVQFFLSVHLSDCLKCYAKTIDPV